MRVDAPVKLAVFDCDGTLVDSQAAIVGAMNAAFSSCALLLPPPESVRGVIGLSLDHAISALYPAGEPARIAELNRLYCEAFAAQRAAGEHADPLYPGAIEALDALAADGWLLGVATGKSMRGLLATLERHSLRERFVTLQTADICRGKPDPHMVERAMSEVGARGRNTVVIGDTAYDMQMARSARAYAIGVSWGYHLVTELRSAGAHEVVGSYPELPGTMFRLTDNGRSK